MLKGIPIFDTEKEILKNEFLKVGLNGRTMGLNTLNNKLKEANIPYIILSKKEKCRTQNRNKYYWEVSDV